MGQRTLDINGNNFGNGSLISITVGGNPCPIAPLPQGSSTHSRVLCFIPDGAGISNDVIVTVDTQASNRVNFAYSAPTVSGINPSSGTTAGNTLVVVTGSSFGLTGGSVRIGNVDCPVVPGSQSHTSISCNTPPGTGSGKVVTVIVNSQSSTGSVLYRYNNPVITNVTASSRPTAGGVNVTLTGTDFGISTLGSVTIGSSALVPVTAVNHTSARFVLPAGEGANLDLILTVDGQSSAPASFSYNSPVITLLSPNPGPTAGGSSLVVTGTDLGFSATVTVNGQACTSPVVVPHTQVTCQLPAGEGFSVPVFAQVVSQISPRFNFNYSRPAITGIPAIQPASADTSGGGVVLTINGTNFGTGISGTVTIGSFACVPISNGWTHSLIRCTAPTGQGANLPVVVTSGSQSSAQSVLFSYRAHNLTGITPTSSSTAGGIPLTINGNNFGTSTTGVSVLVNAANCPVQSVSHTQIVCTVPAGNGNGRSVSVDMPGNARRTLTNAFSYDGPSITSFLPDSADTSGTALLTIVGTSFDTAGTVTVGGSNRLCTQGVGTSYDHARIVCRLPAGEGSSLLVAINTTAGFSTNSGLRRFSYLAPTISSLSPASAMTSGVSAVTSNRNLTISGSSFGLTATVLFSSTPCAVVSQSHSVVICTIPEGTGVNVPVVMTVAGQNSNTRLFSYDAPYITSRSPSGPLDTRGGINVTFFGTSLGKTGGVLTVSDRDCPITSQDHSNVQCNLPAGEGLDQTVLLIVNSQRSTSIVDVDYASPTVSTITPTTGSTAGGVTISLTGTNFGLGTGSVQVRGNPCPTTFYNHTHIRCTLPAGQGLAAQVIVTVASQASPPFSYNYSAPSITALTPQTGPAAGGVNLQVNGTNFGLAATVTVDGKQCVVSTATHTQVTCTLPVGQGSGLPVVLQAADQVATSPFTFRYNSPVVDSVSPLSGPTVGGTTIRYGSESIRVIDRLDLSILID